MFLLLDPETQFSLLESYLAVLQKTIHHVDRDGMCIFRSVQVVLEEKGIEKSIEELLSLLRSEIEKEEHENFIAEGNSLSHTLDAFVRAPSTEYVQQNVDVFLPLLMVALDAKGTVYKIDNTGHISTLAIGPEDAIINNCFFAQTTLRHLDAVCALSLIHI